MPCRPVLNARSGERHLMLRKVMVNPRTPRVGGGTTPLPWRFSLMTFLVFPTVKIASVYLLLGIEDTFWHM